ncbi:MAG: dihydropteroate synthase [Acidobacteriaceae bacterium]|nr:dihydropteroate synthase [Acidobacteriaceae bacterium]
MPFAPRPHHEWNLRTRSLSLGARTLVMGVLNVTPDSFSDGGQYLAPEKAVARALTMLEEGADIIDIGGESTRPGKRAPVAAHQEQQRVLGVIESILAAAPDAILSVDTYRAETARLAIATGAEIVNDVSGFLWDDDMAATCAELAPGVILMHTRGRPDEWAALPPLAPAEVVPLVYRELADRAAAAITAGIPRERLVLDPGFGFGKLGPANYSLLADFAELRALDYPLLAGISRKGFLAATIEARTGDEATAKGRLHATLAAHTAAILAGASIIRVHDVRPAIEAAAIADEILQANE